MDHPVGRIVLLFVRAPRKGTVKTRLAAALGEDATLELYRCFVEDALDMLRQSGYAAAVCHDPEDAGEELAAWLGDAPAFWPQSNGPLGEKMTVAFLRAFREGWDRVLLMGSDIPDLPPRILHEAFESLSTHPAVIGPARDGGYYLIGFASPACFRNTLFEDMPWGSSDVCEMTLKKARQERIDMHVLPFWEDLDYPGDLIRLMQDRINQGAPRTRAWLSAFFSGTSGRFDRHRHL